ncbi:MULTISPECIES: hypothetical protein [Anaerotruncus]|jgi:uncharacterized membrane protein|uniref:hypothetical protein n=1 Tax=Anaerotruncus TaxID=244127 RepID=UPI0008324DAE|nr:MULTISPECIES: hypothetical protein [Anaerotruncus]RGX56893.1 hypothetical protein DWV16_00830 [Anaerotruncus sp. AF02-27]
MKLPRLSIVRSKQVELICTGTIGALLLYAGLPIEKPAWTMLFVMLFALLAGLGIVLEVLIPKEKSDERARKNEAQADALVFNLVYIAAAVVTLLTLGEVSLSITSTEVIYCFVAMGILRSGVFLYYERFGE